MMWTIKFDQSDVGEDEKIYVFISRNEQRVFEGYINQCFQVVLNLVNSAKRNGTFCIVATSYGKDAEIKLFHTESATEIFNGNYRQIFDFLIAALNLLDNGV